MSDVKELVGRRYTEGVCEDGAAILRDSKPLAVTEILDLLNSLESQAAEIATLRKVLVEELKQSNEMLRMLLEHKGIPETGRALMAAQVRVNDAILAEKEKTDE